MGIRSKAKKIKQLLPIVGSGGNVAPSTPQPSASPVARPSAPAAPPMPKTARGSLPPAEFIDAWIKKHNVVLFMKGSPSNPQCGFSANASAVLKSYNIEIAHVDVIADPEVRQGIKDYSNWPTIPQVYIGGEFLGGSDILMQMHEAGELGEMIEAAGESK